MFTMSKLARSAMSAAAALLLAGLPLSASSGCGIAQAEELPAQEAETAELDRALTPQLSAPPPGTCLTSGSYTTGWLYTGDGYDFARGRLSWSGDSDRDGGSLTVTATLEGFAYSSYSAMSGTGVIIVNGNKYCTVSFVDRTPMEGAGTATCTIPVSSVASYTIEVADSASGARWEFIRGGVNNQFHAKVKADQRNGSVQCF